MNPEELEAEFNKAIERLKEIFNKVRELKEKTESPKPDIKELDPEE